MPSEDITVPGPEHEGYREIGFEYRGEICSYKIKSSLYEKFYETAKQRNCYANDLIRAGLDKYGTECKDIFERIISETEDDISIPGAEHEGLEDFTIEYKGDIYPLKVPRSEYNEFLEIAKQRNCRASDLLRAGFDKYGLNSGVIKKIINEKQEN